MRGAFIRYKSIHQFDPNHQYTGVLIPVLVKQLSMFQSSWKNAPRPAVTETVAEMWLSR